MAQQIDPWRRVQQQIGWQVRNRTSTHESQYRTLMQQTRHLRSEQEIAGWERITVNGHFEWESPELGPFIDKYLNDLGYPQI